METEPEHEIVPVDACVNVIEPDTFLTQPARLRDVCRGDSQVHAVAHEAFVNQRRVSLAIGRKQLPQRQLPARVEIRYSTRRAMRMALAIRSGATAADLTMPGTAVHDEDLAALEQAVTFLREAFERSDDSDDVLRACWAVGQLSDLTDAEAMTESSVIKRFAAPINIDTLGSDAPDDALDELRVLLPLAFGALTYDASNVLEHGPSLENKSVRCEPDVILTDDRTLIGLDWGSVSGKPRADGHTYTSLGVRVIEPLVIAAVCLRGGPAQQVGVVDARSGQYLSWDLHELLTRLVSPGLLDIDSLRERLLEAMNADIDAFRERMIRRCDELEQHAWEYGPRFLDLGEHDSSNAVRAEHLSDLSPARQIEILCSRLGRDSDPDIESVLHPSAADQTAWYECTGALTSRDSRADMIAMLGSDGRFHMFDRQGRCRPGMFMTAIRTDDPWPVGAKVPGVRFTREQLSDWVTANEIDATHPHVQRFAPPRGRYLTRDGVVSDHVGDVLDEFYASVRWLVTFDIENEVMRWAHEVPRELRCTAGGRWPGGDDDTEEGRALEELTTHSGGWPLCDICGENYASRLDSDYLDGTIRGMLCYGCARRAHSCTHVSGCVYATYMNEAAVDDMPPLTRPRSAGWLAKSERERLLACLDEHEELAHLREPVRTAFAANERREAARYGETYRSS